jgi:hypothetical protein
MQALAAAFHQDVEIPSFSDFMIDGRNTVVEVLRESLSSGNSPDATLLTTI